MFIEKISLLNFKNYRESDLSFSPSINLVTGNNGSGKTNLLDAIHTLSLSKSAFQSSDNTLIFQGESFFSIIGLFHHSGKTTAIQCDLVNGQKKVLKADKKPYEKMSEHIGRFPVVLITPYDTDIIREGSEERRRFFDTIISQIDAVYLSELVKYNHFLKQRNALLKQYAEGLPLDRDLLAGYDKGLLAAGDYIYKGRNSFIENFIPLFHQHYNDLSENREETGLSYESSLGMPDFEIRFKKNLERDIFLQRTGLGTHKDDFTFTIKGQPLKGFGSQGQQKSYVIALKLAMYDILKKSKGIRPILLLDDIFDKLDDKRIQKLMNMVSEDAFGQIFITDASPERASNILSRITAEIRIFRMENGALAQS